MDVRFEVNKWGGEGYHWDRVRAVMRGDEPDCIPITIWRHFPSFEGEVESAARVHLAFQIKLDLDLIVFTPPFAFSAYPWGFEPGEERDDFGLPVEPKRPFSASEQWPRLRRVDGDRVFEHCLDAMRMIKRNAPGVPLLATGYGPLTTAFFLRGERIQQDLSEGFELYESQDGQQGVWPGSGLREAVKVIEPALTQFFQQALEIADGLYFISYFNGFDVCDDESVLCAARDLDLSPVYDLAETDKLLTLHLHGEEILYDDALDYPFDMYNWHDRWVKPSLRDARMKSDFLLMGGINEADTMHRETPVAVSLQVDDAVNQVKGEGLIISPGGPIHCETPAENLKAAVSALREQS